MKTLQYKQLFSRAILVIVMALLVVSTITSFIIFNNLKAEISNRRVALENRSKLDQLEVQFRDWFFTVEYVRTENQSFNQHSDILLLEREISTTLDDIKNRFQNSTQHARLVLQIENLWVELIQFHPGIRDPRAESLFSVRDELEKLELKRINISDSKVGESLMSRSIILMTMLGLSLIGFTLLGFIIFFDLKSQQERLSIVSKLKSEAESALKIRTQFLAIVSHEIRTPLNGVLGVTDLLLRSETQSDKLKSLNIIKDSGKLLLRIVNDLIDYSAIEKGKFTLSDEKFDIHSVTTGVANAFQRKVEEKKLLLHCDVDSRIPRLLYGDVDRISQVLFNLVSNSIKFTSSGSILIKLNLVSKNDTNVTIKFSVTDTGTGVEEDNISFLFKPFSKAHSLGTNNEPGTGLGLSISQLIVNAMGGNIEFENVESGGSCFSFEIQIPISKHEDDENYIEYIPIETPKNETLTFHFSENKPLILLVEDNPTNQIIAQSMLNNMNLDPILANDGFECLDVIQKHPVDLILMDCQMPRMDGYETTKLLRDNGYTQPILALTADATKQNIDRCIDVGMDDFVTKPISYDELLAKLDKLLSIKKKNTLEMLVLNRLVEGIGLTSTIKVLNSFLETIGQIEEKLKKQENDLDALRKLGHLYKGSSLTVGCLNLAEYCEDLENIKDMKESQPLIGQIIQESTRAKQALEKYRSSHQRAADLSL